MQRRQIYGAGIALAGVLLAVVQVLQGIQQSRRPIVFVFETVPFVLMALALAFAGGWLYRRSRPSASGLDPEAVHEVRSLCIQGILGLSQMVTVVTDGENTRIVDNTIVNVDEELLAEHARTAAEQEPATVEYRESVPTPVANYTSGLLSICLTRHNGSAMVLLAMVDGSTTLADEDMQLLELLVGHARTAIGRIDDEGSLAVDSPTGISER